ncbi:MAG: hypothetical protein EXR28_08235 [Betaproteobacteria bacterium]|nr:hypothetical protein [Betaproteobacteria bacterium]
MVCSPGLAKRHCRCNAGAAPAGSVLRARWPVELRLWGYRLHQQQAAGKTKPGDAAETATRLDFAIKIKPIFRANSSAPITHYAKTMKNNLLEQTTFADA